MTTKQSLKSSNEIRMVLEELSSMLDDISRGQSSKQTAQLAHSQLLHQIIGQLIPMVAYASVTLRQADQLSGKHRPKSAKHRILFNAWADATDVLSGAFEVLDLYEDLSWEEGA